MLSATYWRHSILAGREPEHFEQLPAVVDVESATGNREAGPVHLLG